MARQPSGLWQWLQETGILKSGSKEEVAHAKKEYRANYLREYKRQYRANRKEVTVSVSLPEYEQLQKVAKDFGMTPARALRATSMAYLDKIYLVPDPEQVARLEQYLSALQNTFEQLVWRYHRAKKPQPVRLYKELAQRVDLLEGVVDKAMRFPYPADDVIKEAIRTQPLFRAQLHAWLGEV